MIATVNILCDIHQKMSRRHVIIMKTVLRTYLLHVAPQPVGVGAGEVFEGGLQFINILQHRQNFDQNDSNQDKGYCLY